MSVIIKNVPMQFICMKRKLKVAGMGHCNLQIITNRTAGMLPIIDIYYILSIL